MSALLGAVEDAERDALAALDRADLDAALGVLMRAYGTPLYRYCRQMVADEELAQDAHQLTFVQAYEGLSRFSRRSSLRTWLFGIARPRCLDALKIERRRRRRCGRQGLTYEQIARLTGERAATLQARVARALPLLRRCLEQQGLTP
jgi:RNA polymerase sigma-70 factor (ECF subfamily)